MCWLNSRYLAAMDCSGRFWKATPQVIGWSGSSGHPWTWGGTHRSRWPATWPEFGWTARRSDWWLTGRKEPVDNWLECSKCNEWRIVPSGQFLTFQGHDVKFFCSLVGASCHFVKKRRRAWSFLLDVGQFSGFCVVVGLCDSQGNASKQQFLMRAQSQFLLDYAWLGLSCGFRPGVVTCCFWQMQTWQSIFVEKTHFRVCMSHLLSLLSFRLFN